MMQKITIIFWILALAIGSIPLFGSTHYFEEALVFSTGGDTLSGYVNRLSEKELSLGIVYKKDLASTESITYTPENIRGFQFVKDAIFFESVNYLFYNEKKEKIAEKRFAKKMLEGTISLYKLYLQFEDYEKNHEETPLFVYIAFKEGKWYVLQKAEKNVDGVYKYDNKYIGALKYLTADCDVGYKNLEKLTFVDTRIAEYIQKYNACKNPADKNIAYKHKVKGQSIYSADLAYSTLVNEGISGNYGFGLGFHLNRTQPSTSRRLSINVGLEYHFQKYERTGIASYDRHLVKIPISGRSTFILNEKTKMLVDFGLSTNVGRQRILFPVGNSVEPYRSDIFINVLLGLGFRINRLVFLARIEGFSFSLFSSPIQLKLGLAYILKEK